MQYHAIVQTTNSSLLHLTSENPVTHHSIYITLSKAGIEVQDSVIIPCDHGKFDITLALKPLIDRWLQRTYNDFSDASSIQVKVREFAQYRVISTVAFKSDGGLSCTEAARVLIQHWPELPIEMNQYRSPVKKH